MDARASACLDDDEMFSFVEGALTSQRRQEALAHIDGCEACQGLAAELARDNDAGVPSSPKLETGERVSGRFLLAKVLGRGAMGTVFQARDEKLGIDVALKLLRKEGAIGAREGFSRELRVGRKITHPNVCRLYDAGSTDHHDYITMELIAGDTLARVLEDGELTRERALELLAAIAAGLGAAHRLGIVHRDLKPANVMVERATGRAVLTDFGFATDLDAKHSRRLVGTPAYWAPEQARGEKVTPASDVYAFGVLAYRLLARREFSLSDRNALEHVPRDLRRVVARCVEPRPSDRFTDAEEAGAALVARSTARPRWAFGLVLATVVGGVVWATTHPAPRKPVAQAAPEGPAEPSSEASLRASTAAPVVSASAPAVSPGTSASIVPALPVASSAAPVRPLVTPRPRASVPVAPASASARLAPAASEGDLLYRK